MFRHVDQTITKSVLNEQVELICRTGQSMLTRSTLENPKMVMRDGRRLHYSPHAHLEVGYVRRGDLVYFDNRLGKVVMGFIEEDGGPIVFVIDEYTRDDVDQDLWRCDSPIDGFADADAIIAVATWCMQRPGFIRTILPFRAS